MTTLRNLIRYLLFSGLSLISLQYAPVQAELRDPARPEEFSDGAEDGQLKLNAIIVSPNGQVAVINGRPLKLGDRFGGIKVAKIESNSVEIERNGNRITLYLPEKSAGRPG